MLLSLSTCRVAQVWVRGAAGVLVALPWRGDLVPGQVVELMSCLGLPLEKDPVPSQLPASPRPGSWWQKLLKSKDLPSVLAGASEAVAGHGQR